MNDIKTCRELWGKDPAPGYEWDAGHTPSNWPLEKRLRVSVKLLHSLRWTVYIFYLIGNKKRYIRDFGRGEAGERLAKYYAQKLLKNYIKNAEGR